VVVVVVVMVVVMMMMTSAQSRYFTAYGQVRDDESLGHEYEASRHRCCCCCCCRLCCVCDVLLAAGRASVVSCSFVHCRTGIAMGGSAQAYAQVVEVVEVVVVVVVEVVEMVEVVVVVMVVGSGQEEVTRFQLWPR
jgi:hypothetical protein